MKKKLFEWLVMHKNEQKRTIKIMKLTTLMLLGICLMTSAKTVSQQKVNLKKGTSTYQDVFEEIREQTGYIIMYNDAMLDKKESINIDVAEKDLSELLNLLLEDKQLRFDIEDEFIIIKQAIPVIQEEKVTITGTVKDESGEALIGVNVISGNTGTVTDVQGHFQLEVTPNSTLSFSFIGFVTKEVQVSNDQDLAIVMTEEINELGETLIIGYGKVSREASVGAVTQVNTEVLQSTQNVSFADALIGIVPGMYVEESFSNPDTPPTILLRGVGSINAGTEPLVVVDGIQMPAGFSSSTISTNDIEDISILKDAAATSIYGSRGSNGVIIVKTKRGERYKKPVVSFNYRFGVKSPDKSFTDDIMNTAQKLDYEESLGLYPQSDPDAQALLKERRESGNDHVWADLLMDNETSHAYDFSVAGGMEKANYYASINYNKVNNIYGSKYDRLTATLKFDYEIAKNLKLGLAGTFGNVVNKDKRIIGDPVGNSFLLNPWETIYDENGDPTRTIAFSDGHGVAHNPLFIRDNTTNKSTRRNVYGSANLTYVPVDWLTLKANLGGNVNYGKSSTYENVIVSGGQLTRSIGDNNNYTGNITATVNKRINRHDINWVAGTEFNEYNSYRLYGTANDFLTDAIRTLNTAKNLTNLSESMSEHGSIGYFSRLNYSFDGTYNVSASFRRDGSSKFGDNNKWANFYAIGAAWNMHKTLLPTNHIVSNLKLRGSYGTSGNDFIGDFEHLSLYGFSGDKNKYDGKSVAVLSRGANPDLTWEKNKNTNLGLDLGFVKNRFNVSVDYYIRDTYDLINPMQIPLQSGFRTLMSNIGDFRNKGVEVAINTINFNRGDFRWTTTLNMAYNESEVLDLIEDDDLIERGSVVFQKGRPINALYIAQWAGVNPATGFNKYVNPKATSESDKYIEFKSTAGWDTNYSEISKLREVSNKTDVPKFHGGLTNTFEFKNFDCSFLFSFAGGHYVINKGLYDLRNKPLNNQLKEVTNAWKSAGDETELAVRATHHLWPRSSNIKSDYDNSTQYLQKGDYIKLKNLTLGYSLSKALIRKIGLGHLRIYVQGQNLLTFTEVDYFDPEYKSTGGIGFSSPVQRGFSFGLNANF